MKPPGKSGRDPGRAGGRPRQGLGRSGSGKPAARPGRSGSGPGGRPQRAAASKAKAGPERDMGRDAPSGTPRAARPPRSKSAADRKAGGPRAAPIPRPSAERQFARDDEAALAREEARKAASAEARAAALPSSVQTLSVMPDEDGMRVDRFMEARFPGLSFSHIQRIVRKGELRVDGKRVETKDRLAAGQSVRTPPLRLDQQKLSVRQPKAEDETRAFLKSITLYEDADVMVLDKPMGLAVQGGSGTTRHVDKMLDVLADRDGQTPRLVHRLDKDTSGCLVVAKTRFAAAALAKSFRTRDTRKVYWALVAGVPRVKQGRVSTYLAKDEDEKGDQKMRVAKHGDDGASHAVTYYAVVETAAQKVAWLSMKPVTGRTHQLRAHAAHIGHPIVGDPKYFDIENWELPGGIQQKLHLLARRIVVPHPRTGKPIDVTAPLPPHMQQSWNLLGFDTSRYDPIEEAPSE